MITKAQSGTLNSAGCEIRTDDLTRILYATDASIYQMRPDAVAFPKSAQEAVSAIQAAAEAGVPVTPRGAGTGLAGGAVGDGLIVDFVRHNRRIWDLDLEKCTVRVQAGVVLDQLNALLKPAGYCFGPDVATSPRATLGGMIANNSSGARAPVHGTTAEHVVSLEVVLADGRVATIGAEHPALAAENARVRELVEYHAAEIEHWFPDILVKRWPGYGLDRYLRAPGDLCKIVSGSEGTLAGIFSAELRIVPLPPDITGLVIFFFDSVAEAMQATVEFADLDPSAIEHADRVLFDQTRGQLAFKSARGLMRLDEEPCEAFLIVEFQRDAPDRIAEASRRNVGKRSLIVTDPAQMEMVWNMRKAGLSLLTGRKGPAKPVPGIEDVAVEPKRLPAYVDELRTLMDELGLFGSFYGHAASGLLHVRPVLDLRKAGDIAKYRKLAEGASSLARRFNASFAGEHGVGIARTEFMKEQVGPELLAVMGEIKELFDPQRILNPGKIIAGEHGFRIDTNLRMGDGYELTLPFPAVLAFADKDGSFAGNLEQCNGCGGCRKDAPTMCPTYIAAGEEIMSTRGRANTIRAVLEHRFGDADPLVCAELEEALGNCLSCKACKKECPSNVDMALLKAELLHARHQRTGVGLRGRMVSSVETMNILGCLVPRLANAMLEWKWLRKLMDKTLGFAAERPLPKFALQRFDRWFANHERAATPPATRGRVVLWDDTFVRYNEPHIGIAAVTVLEAAGFEVVLPKGRKDCGRPAFSVGRLDMAKRLGTHNAALLRERYPDDPVVFLEPSSFAMFKQDYRELGVPHASEVAPHCYLFEEFLFTVLEEAPEALSWRGELGAVVIHAHCHAKALTDPAVQQKLASKIPGAHVNLLDSGCCGMAGQFGALSEKYKLSLEVAAPLVRMINERPKGAYVVASGTSCRQQIAHLTDARPLHMAELVALALKK
ncbi:MAG TPA: FAD-linked oxidase C-terminal domain-containing protein [Candidatus Hydrogenedentes bacterium]|nr:FAD-linked oxidase C-terminal domain-containing protein [Candidatus Hydrogenedentota bacterium]